MITCSVHPCDTPGTKSDAGLISVVREPLSLWELARRCLAEFTVELQSYGIHVDPRLELRQGEGRFCYYDFDDGNIYLALPDPSSPIGRLKARLLGASLGCGSERDLMQSFQLVVPWLIAHELGHHLRHRYGRFGENHWKEEHIANRLARALTRCRMSPSDRELAARFLRRAVDALSPHVRGVDAATASFHDLLLALNASGGVDDGTMEQMQIAKSVCAAGSDDFRVERTLGESIECALAQRSGLIHSFNSDYMQDFAAYAYFHAGWQLLELTHHGAEYVADFARAHLGVELPLLSLVESDAAPCPEQIIACYRAYLETARSNRACARYFYRRYRELLLAMLAAGEDTVPCADRNPRDATFFLESWTTIESDPLAHLAGTAPAPLRGLFPACIAAHPEFGLDVDAQLPAEADRRLWAHITRDARDETAATTLDRLAQLDKAGVFGSIPARAALEAAGALIPVHFAAGDTIVWEGEANDDVFFLLEGTADVLVVGPSSMRRIGTVGEGEVIGELAFFHGDVRTATVRAVTASKLLVIRDTDLLRLAYRHPSVLMQLGGALAKRQHASNRHLVQAEAGECACPPSVATRGDS